MELEKIKLRAAYQERVEVPFNYFFSVLVSWQSKIDCQYKANITKNQIR
jgi:hypothetical protein